MSTTGDPRRPRVAIAHDYLTQRGGAERVVLAMHRAFPDASITTTLFDPDGTYPDFAGIDIRTSVLDRVAFFRHHHRLALPVLASATSRLLVDADVTLVSSSGWAHGVDATGRKVVYCHTPARWLYASEQHATTGLARRGADAALRVLSNRLRRWDRRQAYTADRYLANSKLTAQRIADAYGIEAEVLHPPVAVDVDAAQQAVAHGHADLEPGFLLVVARLMPYKHIDAVAQAVVGLPAERLVVVGSGPAADEVRRAALPAGDRITMIDSVSDAQLRWLYANASALVCAARDDFGLTPVEAAAFGTPTIGIRAAGLLETIDEGRTGVYFDEPAAAAITAAIQDARQHGWDRAAIVDHASAFSEHRFNTRLHQLVDELA